MSAPIHTGAGAHPTSYKMDTESLPDELSDRGVSLTTTTPPSSTEVKEKVGLYFYSPSRSSWFALVWTLPFHDRTASRLNANGAGAPHSGMAGASEPNEQ